MYLSYLGKLLNLLFSPYISQSILFDYKIPVLQRILFSSIGKLNRLGRPVFYQSLFSFLQEIHKSESYESYF